MLQLGHISSSPPSDWNLVQLPWFSGLQTQMEIHYQLSWLSSLQTADHGTSQLHKGMTQSLIINLLYILVVLFLCRTLTNVPTSDVMRRKMNRKKSFPQGVLLRTMDLNGQRKPSQKTKPESHQEYPHCQGSNFTTPDLENLNLLWTNDICVFSVSSFSK